MAARSRSTVPAIAAQAEKLEGRVTGVERDLQHVMQTIEKTNETMLAGFSETRRLFQESEERNEERASKLHHRVTEINERALQKGQVSWPFVVSVIGCAVLLVGSFVSFVTMTTQPMRSDIERHEKALAECVERERTHAYATGKADAQREALEKAVNTKTGDRFFGREGAAMDARLTEVEKFLRTLTARTSP